MKKTKIFYFKIFFLFLIFLTVLNTGCKKVSYPKDKIEESTVKILKKEYKLDGRAKLVGNTLYLDIELPELFSVEETENLPKKVLKKLQGAVLTVVRISLSSDAKIDFVVTIAYAKDYDFCVRIIERIKDIKDFLYMRISRSNYEQRLILEMLPYSKITYDNITLKEFAARLMVSRYNMTLKSNPFVAALLNNTMLEFRFISGDMLVLMANNYVVGTGINDLFKSLIEKYYKEVIEKYSLITFPPVIRVEDTRSQEIFSLNPKVDITYNFDELLKAIKKKK